MDDGQASQQLSLAIYSIVEDDYRKRVWILQEVAIAKSVVVEMLEIPAFSLDELFETLFSDHFQRKCSRPHDRVYGLLGLLEEGDPMLCIGINYNKPASDVLFDAVLTVPVYHDTRATELLTLDGFMEDPNSLEEYRDSDQTMPRLKEFASVVLQVFDALNLIMAENGVDKILERFHGFGIRTVPDHLGNFQVDNHIPDELQGKAILGIMLAIGTSNAQQRHTKWRELGWPKLKAQSRSSWLCARHARPVPARWSAWPKYPAALRNVRFLRSTPAWSTSRTCARHRRFRRACEGPKMILDISHIGFRLELDVVVPDLSSVYLDPEKMLENHAEERATEDNLFSQG